MIGVSFGDCQGWYHPAKGHRAVLLCGAHGFEDLCARKSWATLASKLAGAGMPVLRFDYPGTANSAGGDNDENLVARWRESIHLAAAWLKANTATKEIVIVGLRVGGLLAALEASKIESLAGLALLAPVTSGRQYAREMAVLAKIMMPPNAVEAADPALTGEIDVCGFAISRNTESDLKTLSLAGYTPKPDIPVLILSQRGSNLRTLKAAFEQEGCTITERPFAGYDEMICDPTASKVPGTALEATTDWIRSLGPIKPTSHAPVQPSSLSHALWTESAVTFGKNGSLSGVLCMPKHPRGGAAPVIFLNSGMSYHIGWSRMTVRQARALAGEGIASLRYDTAGIGDSLATGAAEELPLYNSAAEKGLSAAIDWLTSRGFSRPLLMGACSGAYTAFHATRKDPRVQKAVIVNLQCFNWSPAIGFEIERWRAVRRNQITAQRASSESGAPLRVLTAKLSGIAISAVRYAGRIAKRILKSKFVAGSASTDSQVVRWFTDIALRRTSVTLVYARGDLGLNELEKHAGALGQRVTRLPGVSLEFIENSDHNITPRQAQDDLLAIILKAAASNPETHQNNVAVA